MIKANLTWSAAAKLYILAAGMAVALLTSQTNAPDWVPAVVAVLSLTLGWAKKQQPVTST